MIPWREMVGGRVSEGIDGRENSFLRTSGHRLMDFFKKRLRRRHPRAACQGDTRTVECRQRTLGERT